MSTPRIVKVPVARCRRVMGAIHTLTFPADEVPRWKADGAAWIAYDGEDAVAFLYAEPTGDGESWYFSRVGVMPAARGKGMQRELMRRLEAWARRERIATLISTTFQNPASANNFVREQWMTYLPHFPWGAADTIYWRKDLRPST
jgi:GNAT superfamily N-acetyltransferase